MKRVLFFLAILAGGALGGVVGQSLDGGAWVKPQGVLFGDPVTCQRPAMVDLKRVWGAIPEVIRIKRDRPGPAERDILLAKATARLKRAIRQGAYDGGFDCVVMKRAIQGTPPAPPVDITKEIIKLVKA